ncbi:hypothetical protein BDK51DRAFT_25631, partial [Blyttiomyces helicus]
MLDAMERDTVVYIVGCTVTTPLPLNFNVLTSGVSTDVAWLLFLPYIHTHMITEYHGRTLDRTKVLDSYDTNSSVHYLVVEPTDYPGGRSRQGFLDGIRGSLPFLVSNGGHIRGMQFAPGFWVVHGLPRLPGGTKANPDERTIKNGNRQFANYISIGDIRHVHGRDDLKDLSDDLDTGAQAFLVDAERGRQADDVLVGGPGRGLVMGGGGGGGGGVGRGGGGGVLERGGLEFAGED